MEMTHLFNQFRHGLFAQSNAGEAVKSDTLDVTSCEACGCRHRYSIWLSLVFSAQVFDDLSHENGLSSTCRSSEEDTLSTFNNGIENSLLFIAQEDTSNLFLALGLWDFIAFLILLVFPSQFFLLFLDRARTLVPRL